MKIFTLPSNIVKKIAGKTVRFFAFYKPSNLNPVQKNKTVVMQNFFATIRKLFTVTYNRIFLPESMTTGYQPDCSGCTTGETTIYRTIHNNDVAPRAASFVLIPLALTPTAMNHPEKKSIV